MKYFQSLKRAACSLAVLAICHSVGSSPQSEIELHLNRSPANQTEFTDKKACEASYRKHQCGTLEKEAKDYLWKCDRTNFGAEVKNNYYQCSVEAFSTIVADLGHMLSQAGTYVANTGERNRAKLASEKACDSDIALKREKIEAVTFYFPFLNRCGENRRENCQAYLESVLQSYPSCSRLDKFVQDTKKDVAARILTLRTDSKENQNIWLPLVARFEAQQAAELNVAKSSVPNPILALYSDYKKREACYLPEQVLRMRCRLAQEALLMFALTPAVLNKGSSLVTKLRSLGSNHKAARALYVQRIASMLNNPIPKSLIDDAVRGSGIFDFNGRKIKASLIPAERLPKEIPAYATDVFIAIKGPTPNIARSGVVDFETSATVLHHAIVQEIRTQTGTVRIVSFSDPGGSAARIVLTGLDESQYVAAAHSQAINMIASTGGASAAPFTFVSSAEGARNPVEFATAINNIAKRIESAKSTEALKAIQQDIIKQYSQHYPEVESILKSSMGVQELWTLEDHAIKVFIGVGRVVKNTPELKLIPLQSASQNSRAISFDEFFRGHMAVVHDLCKGPAAGRLYRQAQDQLVPLCLSILKGMGYAEEAIHKLRVIAKDGASLIGDIVPYNGKQGLSKTDAYEKLLIAAQKANMPPQDFFLAASAYQRADSAAYPLIPTGTGANGIAGFRFHAHDLWSHALDGITDLVYAVYGTRPARSTEATILAARTVESGTPHPVMEALTKWANSCVQNRGMECPRPF